MQFDSPTILRRYLSTFIDAMFIVAIFIAVSYYFNSDEILSNTIRMSVFFIIFFVYEPICTSFFCTIGQRITRIRIRTFSSNEKISIISAYIRIILKLFLGVYSLIAIPFTRDRRAIHDFAAGSVVIMVQ
jgi:uncharacterized RDD family membrane protein YckC